MTNDICHGVAVTWVDISEEQCMLFNNTGICREQCHDDETGFVLSNIGRKFMNIMVYLKNQTAPLQERVPIVDIKEQMPCMWQMSGKPDCCSNVYCHINFEYSSIPRLVYNCCCDCSSNRRSEHWLLCLWRSGEDGEPRSHSCGEGEDRRQSGKCDS